MSICFEVLWQISHNINRERLFFKVSLHVKMTKKPPKIKLKGRRIMKHMKSIMRAPCPLTFSVVALMSALTVGTVFGMEEELTATERRSMLMRASALPKGHPMIGGVPAEGIQEEDEERSASSGPHRSSLLQEFEKMLPAAQSQDKLFKDPATRSSFQAHLEECLLFLIKKTGGVLNEASRITSAYFYMDLPKLEEEVSAIKGRLSNTPSDSALALYLSDLEKIQSALAKATPLSSELLALLAPEASVNSPFMRAAYLTSKFLFFVAPDETLSFEEAITKISDRFTALHGAYQKLDPSLRFIGDNPLLKRFISDPELQKTTLIAALTKIRTHYETASSQLNALENDPHVTQMLAMESSTKSASSSSDEFQHIDPSSEEGPLAAENLILRHNIASVPSLKLNSEEEKENKDRSSPLLVSLGSEDSDNESRDNDTTADAIPVRSSQTLASLSPNQPLQIGQATPVPILENDVPQMLAVAPTNNSLASEPHHGEDNEFEDMMLNSTGEFLVSDRELEERPQQPSLDSVAPSSKEYKLEVQPDSQAGIPNENASLTQSFLVLDKHSMDASDYTPREEGQVSQEQNLEIPAVQSSLTASVVLIPQDDQASDKETEDDTHAQLSEIALSTSIERKGPSSEKASLRIPSPDADVLSLLTVTQASSTKFFKRGRFDPSSSEMSRNDVVHSGRFPEVPTSISSPSPVPSVFEGPVTASFAPRSPIQEEEGPDKAEKANIDLQENEALKREKDLLAQKASEFEQLIATLREEKEQQSRLYEEAERKRLEQADKENAARLVLEQSLAEEKRAREALENEHTEKERALAEQQRFQAMHAQQEALQKDRAYEAERQRLVQEQQQREQALKLKTQQQEKERQRLIQEQQLREQDLKLKAQKLEEEHQKLVQEQQQREQALKLETQQQEEERRVLALQVKEANAQRVLAETEAAELEDSKVHKVLRDFSETVIGSLSALIDDIEEKWVRPLLEYVQRISNSFIPENKEQESFMTNVRAFVENLQENTLTPLRKALNDAQGTLQSSSVSPQGKLAAAARLLEYVTNVLEDNTPSKPRKDTFTASLPVGAVGGSFAALSTPFLLSSGTANSFSSLPVRFTEPKTNFGFNPLRTGETMSTATSLNTASRVLETSSISLGRRGGGSSSAGSSESSPITTKQLFSAIEEKTNNLKSSVQAYMSHLKTQVKGFSKSTIKTSPLYVKPSTQQSGKSKRRGTNRFQRSVEEITA